MIEKFQPNTETLADEAKRLMPRLEKIASVLRECGVPVIDEMLTIPHLTPEIARSRETGATAFPITHEGTDGIRITLHRRKGIIVWFTNGFEKVDNPERQEIEQRLQAEGLTSQSE